ncbi:serine hydrolase domain-containing protein [Streptomyces sp. DSM 42041]|uniref:Serine hydrolase domain-containing protein n=1 Tax=Streptomyces hazeniae TaxID=3075538 RepID=A0ABU2NR69_9ACTN|nr:serine hydrolase domain-containing protein [Streptomyces sp. DSM 42041]MDT0379481.1 serine hydrolase domain-containing protein [Streptomyces sp. DSM 42041]
MVDVQGAVADGFEPVREAFARNLTERGDPGAAVAVHVDGRRVVDLWGGTRNDSAGGARATDGTTAGTQPAHGAGDPWQAGTATVVRSATKGVAATVLHLLHQRGRLDLDAPVGTYWPEFKAHGKEGVLVRHLLSHRAGLPVLDTPLTPAEALDGVSGPAALAAQRPVWEPGTAHGYHAQTYSWLLGELVMRMTGRSIGRWFAEEIARPLGLDLWMGLPDGERHRVATLRDVTAPPPPAAAGLRVRAKNTVLDAYRDPDSLTRRAFGAIDPLPDENDPAYRAAELAASGGIATARSLSRFYAALIGHVEAEDEHPAARSLFTAATLTQARSQESHGPDRVLVVGTRFGLGYMLHSPSSPMLGTGSFGHPGRGGSLALADPESGTAFAYVTRGTQPSVTSDPRAQALLRAVKSCLRG